LLLSKLELNGFKSFPTRTELLFDEGIMGVVGPNGCGKTNILDSIRWVLGEQRSSLLRASKVNEVIFNGTTQLRSADMAEVSLTIKNNRGVLPLEYDELVVTRRLFRSGESEYLLNKSRCRLKDIINLFADTGMGAHAYSIFQQGMVDAVLSDKAEDRRYLFEEAAGITKYKNRKKEALKKLENTETDLIRLNDIIAEIAKNVRSLQRQAAKARRYKTIKEELRDLDIAMASAQIYDFEQKINLHEEAINNRKIQREALKAESNTDEAAVEELKLQVAELNEKISSQAAIAADFSEQAIRVENKLVNIQARLDSGKSNVDLWHGDIDNLRRRIDSLKAQQKQAANQHSEKTIELSKLKEEIGNIESDVLAIKDQLDKSKKDLDTIKEKLHRCDNEVAADQAKLAAVNSSIERLNNFNHDLDLSLSKYKAKMAQSQQNLELQKQNLQKCETDIASYDDKINANQKEHLTIVFRIDEIKKQLSTCQAEKSATQAKLEMLSKMILQHEGYGSGIKSLFSWSRKPEGVIDTLANLVTADKQYHLAVEAALNTYGQLVVCRTREDALAGVDYLRENSSGRVAFLLLDGIDQTGPEKMSIEDENFIGSVAELIHCQDFLRPAVNRLFSGIAVFGADKISENLNCKGVDLDGNYYDPISIIEGGKSTVTLIGRKSELSDLQEALQSIESKGETLRDNLDQNETALKNTADEAENLRGRKKTLLNSREKLIGDMTRIDFEFQDSVSRIKELTQSTTETGRQAEVLNREKAEVEANIARKEAEKQDIAQDLFNQSQGHKTLEDKYEKAVSTLNQNRLRSVELTGFLHKLEDDGKRYLEMIDEAGSMIEQKSGMIADEEKKWQELDQEMIQARNQLTNIFKAREVVEDDKSGLNNSRIALVGQLNESELKLKRIRTGINDLNEAIHREELKFADYGSSIKTIKQTMYHEYGLQIVGKKPADFDSLVLQSEIDKLKQNIENVGPVNMLADEEYTTEKDRLEFLEKQYADLQEAKSSLLDVIRKINKTAEEKFSGTFELIRENFQGVFETLFEGGKAEIRLTNPDDLLETPIEIIARPGSKKLISVNQLSGGERALTAISLLFAIYMVKPSPFCVLDEIDAPLDDANVTRFIKLINNFTHSTQFIVITHNKKTMEAADILYGITMEKPGASNIVSVKFNGNIAQNVQ